MELSMKAIETEGTVDEQGHLHVDQPLPVPVPSRVRVIILYPEDDDIDEQEWLRGAANNPVFDFLKDGAEDIYTLTDGRPFKVKR